MQTYLTVYSYPIPSQRPSNIVHRVRLCSEGPGVATVSLRGAARCQWCQHVYAALDERLQAVCVYTPSGPEAV